MIPGIRSFAACRSIEKLKLKIMITMTAKKNIEEIFSRLRISLARSFQTIHRITLKNFILRCHILYRYFH